MISKRRLRLHNREDNEGKEETRKKETNHKLSMTIAVTACC